MRSTGTPTRRWVKIVGVVVGVVAIAGVVRTVHGAMRLRDAAKASAEFHACLYGSPLEEGEDAHARLIAIQLCGPRGRPKDWPATCRPHLMAMVFAFDAMGVTDDDPRFGTVHKLARIGGTWNTAPAPWLVNTRRPFIDELEDAIGKADLPGVPAAPNRDYCRAKPVFGGAELAPLGSTTASGLRQAPVFGPTPRVVWPGDDDGKSLACWFSTTGAAVARCGNKKVSAIARPLAAEESVRDVLMWDFLSDGPNRIVAASGSTLVELSTIGKSAWARSDTAVSFVDFEGRLWRGSLGKKPERLEDKVASNVAWSAVRPGYLLRGVRVDSESSSDVRVFATRLDGEGAVAGEPQELGVVPRGILRTCRSLDGGTTLMFMNEHSTSMKFGTDTHHRIALHIAFTREGRFSKLVEGVLDAPWSTTFGADPDEDTRLVCKADGTPRWVWLTGDELQVHDATCTPSGCKQAVGQPLAPAIDDVFRFDFAALGDDRVLVAYEGSDTGPVDNLLHAVRVRVGPAVSIGSAPDRVVVTEEDHGGLPQPGQGLFVFSRGNVGWFAIQSSEKLYVFRVEPNDEIVPVKATQ